ncbi:MAG: hypothetical protein NT013_08265, partial [Planctomycetia bacterium]|nr:hypothetical protein [Planctomycetia bacterium]
DLHRQTDTIAARSSVLPTAPPHHPHHKNPTSRTPNLMAGYFLVVALAVIAPRDEPNAQHGSNRRSIPIALSHSARHAER